MCVYSTLTRRIKNGNPPHQPTQGMKLLPTAHLVGPHIPGHAMEQLLTQAHTYMYVRH